MKKFLVSLAPIALIALMNLWVFSNRERFPDPLAIHWGASGEPDGFGTLDTHMLWVNIGLGMVVTFWVAVSFIRTPVAMRRLFQLVIGYLFALLSLIMLQTLLVQLDQPSSQGAELGLWVFVFVLPVFGLIPLLLAKPTIEIADELVVRLRGISFLRVPLADIANASEAALRARDFGGWGIRYASKTTAFVPNSGPALLLELHDGSRVLIRSDQAQDQAREINQNRKTK